MSDKTQHVAVSDLKRFAEISRRNGTQDAFVDVALQWAEKAGDYVETHCHPRIAELEAKVEPSAALGTVLMEVSAFIEKHLGDTAMAHLVMPDPRADRVPWIEVRCCTVMPVELEEEIETAWPDIEFELVYTDEDGL